MNEQTNCSLLLKYVKRVSFITLISFFSATPVFAALTPHKALDNHTNPKRVITPFVHVGSQKANHTAVRFNIPLPVNPAPPVITLPGPQTFTTGTAITPIKPSNTGGVIPATAYGVSTFAGSGALGYANGPGKTASFYSPDGVAADASGNLYVTDANSIRKITPTGVVSIIAGGSAIGSANGTGTAASFYSPAGLDVDSSGNIYVADYANRIIRKIDKRGL